VCIVVNGIPEQSSKNRTLLAYEHIMRLDSLTRPGLTKKQFEAVLRACPCGLVATRQMFDEHDCLVPDDVEIIDLTDSDVDD
jgi:hypothetical protein